MDTGTYLIAVYDLTTGSAPITTLVIVETDYIEMKVSSPIPQINYYENCKENGKLTINLKNGNPPYKYKITGPVNKEIIASTTEAVF